MIKKILKKNIYLDYYSQLIKYSLYNYKYQKIVNKFSKIDLIINPDLLSFNKVIELLYKSKKNKYQIFKLELYNSESILYGHYKNMLNYSKIGYFNFVFSPFIEHGINFSQDICFNQIASIFQGNYKKNIENLNSNIPYFSVGPYIHYAKSYYDKSILVKEKEKIGKCLLIFPSHSMETFNVEYNYEKFAGFIKDKFANDYDTIMICLYWNDLYKGVGNSFEKLGFKVVTAGFRGDINFLRRLKSIILLSDHVLANEIGTNIGYSIYLNRPVCLLNTNKKKEMPSDYKYIRNWHNSKFIQNEKNLYSLFALDNGFIITEEQRKIVNYFWGIEDIKSPFEMSMIFHLSKELLVNSFGFIKLYPNSILKLLNKYEKKYNSKGETKLKILKSSLSRI